MRLFYALPVPSQFKEQLIKEVRSFWRAGESKDISWVKPEQVHVTLRFIGECSSNNLAQLEKVGEIVASFFYPFALATASFGVFPGISRPKIIWIGFIHSDTMQELALRLEEELVTIGFPKENKPFTLHLTVGRIKQNDSSSRIIRNSVEHILSMKPLELIIPVEEFHLIESTLTPKGAVYSLIKRFPLTAKCQRYRNQDNKGGI